MRANNPLVRVRCPPKRCGRERFWPFCKTRAGCPRKIMLVSFINGESKIVVRVRSQSLFLCMKGKTKSLLNNPYADRLIARRRPMPNRGYTTNHDLHAFWLTRLRFVLEVGAAIAARSSHTHTHAREKIGRVSSSPPGSQSASVKRVWYGAPNACQPRTHTINGFGHQSRDKNHFVFECEEGTGRDVETRNIILSWVVS
jgi:hypothetical protein